MYATRKSSRLLELVDRDILQKIVQSFYQATGFRATIVDTNGDFICNYTDSCKFCRMVWKYQNGFERCQGAYFRAGKQAAKYGEPYIFRCPAGLIEWAASIIIDGEHLGSIICGQVLMWEPEEFFWIELKEMNKALGTNIEPLMDAVKELEVIPAQRVQAAADLLNVSANYIVNAGWQNLCQQRELFRQQAMMAEEFQSRKDTKAQGKNNLDYPIQKERDLIKSIKLGNKPEAREILIEILVDIFINGSSRIPVIKSRVLELSAILSRAVVEGGVDFEESLKINTKFVQEISQLNTIEEVDHAMIGAFEEYIDLVQQAGHEKNSRVIKDVKKFIYENYHRNLTLEEIANSVYLSPYYLSRIFKESEKTTLMNYLTQIRVDEAKTLLRNPKYNIEEISDKLGYSNPSYFSKVFRRQEGKSPSQFRQQA